MDAAQPPRRERGKEREKERERKKRKEERLGFFVHDLRKQRTESPLEFHLAFSMDGGRGLPELQIIVGGLDMSLCFANCRPCHPLEMG